jgi:hypothetical protein
MDDDGGNLFETSPIEETPAPETRRRPRFLVPAIAIVAAVVLVVAGVVVLGGDDEPTPVELLGAAPAAAREAKTALMTLTADISGQGQSATMEGKGAVDFVTGSSTLEMTMFGTSMEMRMIDSRLYLHMDELGQVPGLDASWISVPVPKAADGGAQLGVGASGAGMLDALAGVSEDGIEELGDDTIDGQDVTGYRVTVDLDKALDQLPEDQRADLEIAREQMANMGLESWPMEVWLNDDGLPARISLKMKMTGVDVDMRVDFSDYGADVDVSAPDPDDTRAFDSITEMQQELGALGAGASS